MPEGLLPARLFGNKPPACFTSLADLHTPHERMYWARPRILVGVIGLLTLIAGGVIAKHAEVGLMTDGVQGIGIFFIIVGCMAFSIATGVTWMEVLLDGDAPLYAFGMLVLTMVWSVITGIVLASSEEFARRLVGLLTVMTVVLLFFLLLWYLVMHVVSQHFEIPSVWPEKDSDPANVYHVLALAACNAQQQSAESGYSIEQPTLWELLSGPQFKAWAAFYKSGTAWSLVIVTAGALLKAVDNDVVDLPQEAVDGVKAVGELLACFGAAGMLVSLAAGAAEFLPSEALVEDIGYPERVRNRLACACISVPVLILNSIWLVARGADLMNNSEAVAMKCLGAVLLVGAGGLALAAMLHVALILFGARLTEELQNLKGDTTGDGAPSSEPLPPDKEMLPFPPIAMKGLSEQLKSLGVGPYQAWQVLETAPWRKWWHRRLLPAYLSGIMALLSGITAALRTELWDPAPSAWIELLVPLFGELMAVGAAMCFLRAAVTVIHFFPIRAECEALTHFFNFVWCAARATHTFTFDKAALRLAGMLTMLLALNELRLALKAVLVLAAKLAITKEEEVKLLGRQPHSLPILHVASLLVNGGRWSVQEFQRELRRDRQLRVWNRGLKTQFFGCLLLAFFGGVLKDDIMMPVLDLMLAKTMLNEEKHKDLHMHVLKPAGNVLAAIGATLLMQRLIAPLIEGALWIVEAGLPHRLRCADVFAASFNAMWLVIYGVFMCGSDIRSERVVGILLISLALVRCSMFVGGGLLLIRTQRGPVVQTAARYMVEDSAGAGASKDAKKNSDTLFEDACHIQAAEEPIPYINCSSPHRPGYRNLDKNPGGLLVTPPEKPGLEFDEWQREQSGVPLVEDGQMQGAKDVLTTPSRPLHWQPVPPMAPSGDGVDSPKADSVEPAAAAGIMPTMLGQTVAPPDAEPQKTAPAEKLPAGAPAEAPPDLDSQVAALPLLAQIGVVEPASAHKTWLLTQLGRAWLLANFVASGWFFLMGLILQQHWAPLQDGQVNERAVAAVVGAGLILLTGINAVVCGLTLNREVHGQ